MSTLSNSSFRAVEVINFLAAHPTESFTLSELAGQLGLSNGSAHRVLTTLTEARFLSRHAKHKTYTLGVALVAIGQAALEKHRGIDVARREMARLTAELQAQCIATAVVDDELLFLAKEGTPQTHEGLNRVGERRPFVPPLGLGHIAWGGGESLSAYMARAASSLGEPMKDYLLKALAVIRQRGYALAANGGALRELSQMSVFPIHEPRERAYWERLERAIGLLTAPEIQLLDTADAGSDGISYISVPVFSPSGEVALELSLTGIPQDLGVLDIERHAQRLRTAAAIITSETHGRPPVGDSVD